MVLQCSTKVRTHLTTYSHLLNNRACTLIYFWEMFHHARFQNFSFLLKIEWEPHSFQLIALRIVISDSFQLLFSTLLDWKCHFHHARFLKFGKSSIMHAYSAMHVYLAGKSRLLKRFIFVIQSSQRWTYLTQTTAD